MILAHLPSGYLLGRASGGGRAVMIAALIGSVATVIFIEHRQKKQYIENVKYREAVQRRIQQLDARQPG